MKCQILYPFPNDEVKIFAFPFSLVDGRMYILLTNKECIVVDPVNDDDGISILKNKGIEELKIILTHEHCDHITGVKRFRDNFDCELICTKECAEAIPDPRKNLSQFSDFWKMTISERNKETVALDDFNVVTCEADNWFEKELSFLFGKYKMQLVQSPGHSKGSLCMVVTDVRGIPICLFTGDSLMADYEVSTRFPGGSRKKYDEITLPFLKSFMDDVIVYPGHGSDSLIKDIQF